MSRCSPAKKTGPNTRRSFYVPPIQLELFPDPIPVWFSPFHFIGVRPSYDTFLSNIAAQPVPDAWDIQQHRWFFHCHGTIAKRVIFREQHWTGETQSYPYKRQRNPNTILQQLCRSKFSQCMTLWAALSPESKESWERLASGKPYTGKNLFIKRTITNL